MEDNVILKLPVELQYDIQDLIQLEEKGWSRNWNDLAMTILLELNTLRDNNLITNEDWKHIQKKYLKSIGTMGEKDYSFFNFLLASNC